MFSHTEEAPPLGTNPRLLWGRSEGRYKAASLWSGHYYKNLFNREQISSVIYGVAASDALGAPFEFFHPEEIGDPESIEMLGGENKLFSIDPGEWTDDTEMTLLLAETIGRGMPLDLHYLADSYISWSDGNPKDIGATTRAALQGSSGLQESTRRAREFHLQTGRSAGNGTIMRASPLALLPLEEDLLWDTIIEEAQITHYAPEAGEASAIFVLALRQLLNGDNVLASSLPLDPLSSRTREAVEGSLSQEFVARVVSEGGSAWSSLAAALWGLSFGHFSEGVRAVIGLGYDTDTNAACAGALLAARYGMESIPSKWIHPLHDKKRIDRAIDGILSIQQ